jgi:hypothetical protein
MEFTYELSKEFIDEISAHSKGNVVRFIRKNFRRGLDYVELTRASVVSNKNGRGGRKEVVVMLTEETADLVRSTYNMKNSYVRKVKDIAVKNIVMSLENSTIGFMCNALKPLFSAMIRQYKVGKYRVDLYIPDIYCTTTATYPSDASSLRWTR